MPGTKKSKDTPTPAAPKPPRAKKAPEAVETPTPKPAVVVDEGVAAQKQAFKSQSPAVAAGIGLIRVDGTGEMYVGVAPARDPGARSRSGVLVTMDTSTFTPIGNVGFDPNMTIKDPATGEFYTPDPSASSWAECELNGNKLF